MLRAGLWVALAATLGSAILAPSEESSRREPRAEAQRESRPTPGAQGAGSMPNAVPVAAVVLDKAERPIDDGLIVDLFQARRPRGNAAAAPKPSAPPLPFAYMGSVEKNGSLKVYLVQGDSFHEVATGGEFAHNYRLDAIGAEGLTITYLPLNFQQQLATGGAK